MTKLQTGTAKPKQGNGSWYSERGTYTEPSEVPGMEWVCRAGKRLALVAEITEDCILNGCTRKAESGSTRCNIHRYGAPAQRESHNILAQR